MLILVFFASRGGWRKIGTNCAATKDGVVVVVEAEKQEENRPEERFTPPTGGGEKVRRFGLGKTESKTPKRN